MTPRRVPGETDLAYLARLAATGERLRAEGDAAAVRQLIPVDGESDDVYALRALALGCDDAYRRRIPRRSLN